MPDSRLSQGVASKQEAIAVLFSIDPDKAGDVSYDIFRESDEGAWADPITRAEALMQSCRDDFPPTRIWTFTGNKRAAELRSKTLLKRMGIED